ncbi:MAG: tRNA (N6-isopentenyl adenosine(37)-C2)-methylthiotransferase MiaB [Mycoplasmataceae bacterium]|nr:tRNA (N6-isopentenyl adenosine(37)-C2)-methylthiotransferase MiaB [Mycoplasmataceae bacterium]
MKKNNYDKYFLPNMNDARKRTYKSLIKTNKFTISNQYKNIGKNFYYYIRTYGCQANIRDTEQIKGILEAIGFKETENVNQANLVILNTCAVRENAENKVFGEIGLLKRLTNKKNFYFGVCGCMAQEKSVVDKIVNKSKHINFVIGTHNIHMLPEVLYRAIKLKERVIHVLSKEEEIIENLPSVRQSNIKAFVNIMYGCDKFCTYCIVPYTRGRIRSRGKDDILNEINNLVKHGCKEVTLLGQNVNSYGIDINNKYYFSNLLEDVAKTNIPRVRFVTCNPWNFDLKIIKVMKKYKNIMPYIHLPVQSGDEQILIKMNREMLINDYLKIIKSLKKEIKDISISTDIIVGFPNESNIQFQHTLDLYNKVKFDNAYTFIYSKREGTPASLIEDKISNTIKQKRLQMLNELVKKYAKWNNEKYLNQILQVLVEGRSKTNKNVWFGYSPQWKVVNFMGDTKIGDIVDVKILSASRFSLNGILLGNKFRER